MHHDTLLRTNCFTKMVNAAYCTVVSNLMFFIYLYKRNFCLLRVHYVVPCLKGLGSLSLV